MALKIEDPEVERLVAELSELTGESEVEVIRQALKARLRDRTQAADRAKRFLRFLEEEIWPNVPAERLGKRLPKLKREEILGYDGYDPV